jgi:hypothetical protein
MVRQYLPEREDGLVSWRVAGKRRPTRTIQLDVTRSEDGVREKNLGPKGEDNAGQAPARQRATARPAGRAARGTAPGTPIEPEPAAADPA